MREIMKPATVSSLLLLLLGVACLGGSHSWGKDVPSLQKRAGGAGQPGTGWQDAVAVTAKNYNYNQQGPPTALGAQYPVKTPAKGGVTVSSSASRMHPGLLEWVKFW